MPYSVDRKDVATQVQGLKKRLGQALPRALPGMTEKIKALATELARTFTPLEELPSVDEWLEDTHYAMHRKDELRRVHSDLDGRWPNRKETQKVNSFVKSETYPAIKHARWINSRCDKVKVTVGPAFRNGTRGLPGQALCQGVQGARQPG